MFTLNQELDFETAATAKVLERLPADRMDWRPNPKSMTLGELALHVATIPGAVTEVLGGNGVEAKDLLFHPHEADAARIQKALAGSVEAAKSKQWTEAELAASWSVLHQGQAAMTISKEVARRLLMLNHWYHHRGQLTVYLRLLDVPVPRIYGASADDNPFA